MSRKDFQALAYALRMSKPVGVGVDMSDSGDMRQWKRDVEYIADVCNGASERFDMARFLSACDYE